MKKRILNAALMVCLLLGCIMLTSCSNASKSVLEPLTQQEREKLIDEDEHYARVFSLIDWQEKEELTASDRKTLEGLTYGQLKDFVSRWRVTSEYREMREKALAQEWEQMYAHYYAKVDSIDLHWKQVLEEKIPSSWVKVEWIDMTDKSEVVLGHVKIALRLTPLKGPVDRIQLYYGLTPKGHTPFYTYFETTGRNCIEVNQSFSSPIVCEGWMSFNTIDLDARKVGGMSVAEVQQMYAFDFNITSLVCGGKSVSYAETYGEVPFSVRNMWKNRDDCEEDMWKNTSKDIYYASIVNELIDPAMPYKGDYVRECVRREASKDNEVAARYFLKYL